MSVGRLERFRRAGTQWLLIAGLLIGALSVAAPAPTTGTLDVQAILESGCRVDGQPLATSGADFGELDFDRHPSLFKQPLTAQSQLASSTLQLKCVGIVSAQITVGAGMHVNGGQRYLESGGEYVPYDLFLDGAASQPLSVNIPRSVPIAANGALTIVDLSVFGRVPPSVGGYVPGIYRDQVQVTVSW